MSKKLIILMTAIVLLLAVPALVLAAGAGKSKAKPPTKISAKFIFADNGVDTLTIDGKAKGLAPDQTYISLVYGPGSEVKGIDACKPNVPNTLGPVMLVGAWTVDGDGKGTLGPVTNITSLADDSVNYVPLGDIGTISVRLILKVLRL